MNSVRIIIGHESLDEERAAVNEAFTNEAVEIVVDPSLVRMSADWDSLPMTIMIFAQALAPNVIWDLIKHASKKLFNDRRLVRRPPTIVVKRKSYDVVLTKESIRIRSLEEVKSFNSLDDLLKYEQSSSVTTGDEES